MNVYQRLILARCALCVTLLLLCGCGAALSTPHTSAPAQAVVLPRLTWAALGNAAYPSPFAAGGVAQLSGGGYRARYASDPAHALTIALEPAHAAGDLDGDGADDAVVVLAAQPGAGAVFRDLVAVLNVGGVPAPVAALPLGDHVVVHALRVVAQTITLELDTPSAQEPFFYPTTRSTRRYALVGGRLTLRARVDTPRAGPPPLWRADGPQPLTFAPGARTATITADLAPDELHSYMLRARAGQTLTVTLSAQPSAVVLSISGADERRARVSILEQALRWTSTLTTAQEFTVRAVPIGGAARYTLHVAVSGGEPPVPLPVQPGGDKVIYLTFDDGPARPWTPAVLDLLARYNAHATFFVVGANAARNPDLIAAIIGAGDTVANHTYNHATLSGLGRAAFAREVTTTSNVLGAAESRCLRPPYGARDAFTQAYAEELGYRVMLWTIDPRDWARPGADAIARHVLARAQPGAIVLMHDGGGDRAQTLLALDTILRELSAQGYTFAPVC